MKIAKTNAARILDAKKIKYELIPYVVDESDLAANHIAEQLNENIEQVFKTLVLRGDKNGLFVCVIPANSKVDLKKAAKVSGNKKAEMILMKDLLSNTGYIRGACSPIGMKKLLPTYFYTTATNYPYVYMSAGVRGLQLKVDAKDVIAVVKGILADIIE